MKRSFSSRLSPQAKKAALLSTPEARASVLVQLTARANVASLTRELAGLDGQVVSWMPETRQLSADVPATALEALAELPDVVYVELATRYSQ